jgi:hypothetical protein
MIILIKEVWVKNWTKTVEDEPDLRSMFDIKKIKMAK